MQLDTVSVDLVLSNKVCFIIFRRSRGLSVLGCAIVPELKPRAPTMSQRDLTRAHLRA